MMSVTEVNETLPDYPTLIHFTVFFSIVRVSFHTGATCLQKPLASKSHPVNCISRKSQAKPESIPGSGRMGFKDATAVDCCPW